MKMSLLPLLAATLACGDAALAQSVYKCTNADGSVSYQDRACPGAADEKKVRVGKPARKKGRGYDGKVVPVPGIGEAAVLVFDYMETIVRQDGERGTTIGIRSKPGTSNKMSMMLTVMPNPQGSIPSRQQQENDVRQIAMEAAGMGFADFRFQDFEARSGTGLLSVVDDPRYPDGAAPAGEFATVTAGQIVSDTVVIAVTILSDGVDNKGFTDALAIAKTFVVAPGIVAINNESGELELPDPPPGFSWQQAPRIKGAFLRPDGWHFDTRHESGDYAYFISREPNVPPDGFDTGLTINVQTDVTAKTGMSPSQYAAEFIRAGAGEIDVIGEPFSMKRGPFESHGALFRAEDPDKGDFNAHMVAIANNATGTVYFCIFEGPAGDWEKIWQIGEQMLEKLVIDDSI